ncbi:MAG: LysM peptidoglycan-binding domain-containing protein [Proteobacteria bacterium]|nr:MAG: LysM peptidoglycan-binding domain-containing protein [Pseudomonadota bacterium]
MKRSLVKLIGITYLFAATHLMTVGCSSSEEGAEDEVTTEEGNEAADAEGEEGNNENTANNEEGGENAGNNFGNNEGGNAVANNEFGNGAESGNAALGAEGTGEAAPTGDENLSQIIDEMNGGNAAAAAPAPEAGFDNLAQNGAAAAAPVETAAAAAPAAAPVSGSPVAPGLPELGSKMAYIVQKGDTLGKIAQRVYGDTNKWTEIADFTGIANPKLIYPGDVVYYQLTETTTTFASAYEGIGRSEVEVGQGDTLATIAQRVFGNSSLWKLIWRQNDKIDNPDRLTAGTKVYYIDHAKLADLHKEVSTKVAAVKVKEVSKKVVKADKEVSKTKSKTVSKSTKSIEVANDQVVDQFSHINSQNLVARLI